MNDKFEIDALVALNTLQQLMRADAKGVYFNSPDNMVFDGSATGYWEIVARKCGATESEIAHAKGLPEGSFIRSV